MKKTQEKLIGSVHKTIDAAIEQLLKTGHATKMCRCTIRKGLMRIVMIIRQPFWSGGNKKSRVFEVIMRVTGAIRRAHGPYQKINKVLKFERLVNLEPIYGLNPIF